MNNQSNKAIATSIGDRILKEGVISREDKHSEWAKNTGLATMTASGFKRNNSQNSNMGQDKSDGKSRLANSEYN